MSVKGLYSVEGITWLSEWDADLSVKNACTGATIWKHPGYSRFFWDVVLTERYYINLDGTARLDQNCGRYTIRARSEAAIFGIGGFRDTKEVTVTHGDYVPRPVVTVSGTNALDAGETGSYTARVTVVEAGSIEWAYRKAGEGQWTRPFPGGYGPTYEQRFCDPGVYEVAASVTSGSGGTQTTGSMTVYVNGYQSACSGGPGGPVAAST